MTSDTPRPFDAELPILAEIEAALVAELRGREAAARGRPPIAPAPQSAPAADPKAGGRGARLTPRPRTHLSPRPRARLAPGPHTRLGRPRRRPPTGIRTGRAARRVLVLVLLTCLLAAAALAARSLVGDGGTVVPARPVPIAAAERASDGGWSLSAYRRGDRLCHAFLAAGSVATRCGPAPGPRAVRIDGLLTPQRRYVVGMVGDAVAEVLVQIGGARHVRRTLPVPRATRHARTALPRGLRWFVVALPRKRTASREAPARVTPRSASGRPLVPAALNCSVGQAAAACRRAAGR